MGRNTDTAPAHGVVAITPDNNADIGGAYVRAIMVGAAGNVNARFADGSEGVIPALEPGTLYPFNITRVFSTNTTATGIVGFR